MYYTFEALIVEPNEKLMAPYQYLPRSYNINRHSSADTLREYLEKEIPSIIFISASLGPTRTLEILEAVRQKVKMQLPGLVVVVDLTNPLSFVIGTHWGGKIAVVDTLITPQEFFSTLTRVI